MKKNIFRVNFILPNDEEITEFLLTKTNRVSKVYDQINVALFSKYQVMLGDVKSLKVHKL